MPFHGGAVDFVSGLFGFGTRRSRRAKRAARAAAAQALQQRLRDLELSRQQYEEEAALGKIGILESAAQRGAVHSTARVLAEERFERARGRQREMFAGAKQTGQMDLTAFFAAARAERQERQFGMIRAGLTGSLSFILGAAQMFPPSGRLASPAVGPALGAALGGAGAGALGGFSGGIAGGYAALANTPALGGLGGPGSIPSMPWPR